MLEAFAAETFTPAPRTTPDDEARNTHSLNRKLDEKLFLVLKRNGSWTLPTAPLAAGATLRKVRASPAFPLLSMLITRADCRGCPDFGSREQHPGILPEQHPQPRADHCRAHRISRRYQGVAMWLCGCVVVWLMQFAAFLLPLHSH
jgi:hypothetical protein